MSKKVKVKGGLPRTSTYRIKTGGPYGILIHDTVTPLNGSNYWTRWRVLNMLANGVNQGTKTKPKMIPGPLYHYLIRGNGEAIQITDLSWKSNNAGRGSTPRLARLKRGENPLTVGIGSEKSNGNGWLWGIALGRNGKKPMTAKMEESLVDTICDLFRQVGWPASESWRVMGHREWTARKRDPVRVNMDLLRAKVANRLAEKHTLSAPPVPKPHSHPTTVREVAVLHMFLERFIKFPTSRGNKDSIRLVQTLVGSKPDGIFGPNTKRATEKYLERLSR